MKKIYLNNFLFLFWNYFNLISIVLKIILINKFLMLAFLNYISFIKIILNNFIYYYTRSKNYYWFKGFCSKNFQIWKIFYIDCDMDLIILKILQIYNISCHTNYFFCNFNRINL